MSYRVITLCLEHEKNIELLMQTASTVAGLNNTSVQAIHVLPSGTDYLAMSPYIQGVPLAKLYDKFEEIAESIHLSYETLQTHFPSSVTWDWHKHNGISTGDFTPYIDHSLVSDLVICAKKSDVALGNALPRTLIKESSVPVLVVPENQESMEPFKRIVVAWNETPESARAVRDALPFLKQAELVIVVNFSKTTTNEVKGTEVGRYLGKHGIHAQIQSMGASDDVGTDLLRHVQENNMEMLIMGGFGHSSLYHLVLGAATPTLLKQMDCPVLLSK